ncbi:lytic transglycosylase domain-containing protein [Sphingomonas sp. SUN019]|uniref:lytic transglycosylase domain-containing protein n=1 Tax=Sphingomonas sp. SUN019 TaxID=2937788 RepID=UPI0021641962|nr:lytic transglycosylase domain-containing protein [Sphingomonas sp. SUN019]UVO50027.1 lytic transglycosylase domain-containing protein [Sphingomonas sp. SUN019]
MSKRRIKIDGFLPLTGVVLTASVAFYAVPASAGTCEGGAFGGRFSEAAKLCGAPAAANPTSFTPASAVVVPESSGPVSISMPGYRKRLAAAVRQVQRSGGASNDALVAAIGHRYRIDPHLLASMVTAESAGNPRAVSNKGALGLMQVMPGTARSLGVRDPRALLNDRGLALSTGAAYLKQLQRQFGNNVPLVVAAYNAGPGAVVKYKGIPRYRETQGYVGKVMSRYAASRSGTVSGAAR